MKHSTRKAAMILGTCSLTLMLGQIQIITASAKPDCENARTQTEMNICSAAEYQAADKILNKTFNHHIKGLSKSEKQALQSAQRSWITYRDQACYSFSLTAEGGSIQPLIQSNCLNRLTNERTQLLNDQFPER